MIIEENRVEFDHIEEKIAHMEIKLEKEEKSEEQDEFIMSTKLEQAVKIYRGY